MLSPKPLFSPAHLGERAHNEAEVLQNLAKRLSDASALHAKKIQASLAQFGDQLGTQGKQVNQSLQSELADGSWLNQAQAYWTDALQRTALTLDTLRERGNNDLAHEAAGTPPVLAYDHELVVDGQKLAHPVNYQLLHILPPKGVTVHDWKRPYMIIDPRAGHGAGIGGFKEDSQVGVALKAGHPVYFVVFRQRPVEGQTLADVMRAEAGFVREIARRHPDAPAPVIVGNCQGGWATMLLAAANPDITGPLVINGAPMAYWSGHVGESPMRYNGGLLGGALPALLMSDLGHGQFDGAHLVSNFEMLNPGRNLFGKYYDLFANIDSKEARDTFLEFERWWGGYHFTNEAEIRWIVEQLFVGNKLARGEASLEHGRTLDLKAIRSPIIVFASRGDNITPPQQALNWIVDTYANEREIVIRGNRIIYMVHEKVGHLGIFVSSSVAKKEHAEMASTLKTIESLAPGLYEMVIEDIVGEGDDAHFVVSFGSRTMADVLNVMNSDRSDERDFAAVARLSEMGVHTYETLMRPMVQSMVTPQSAQTMEANHPSRTSRRMMADSVNPSMPVVKAAAAAARADRKPVDASNPFLMAEHLMAAGITQAMDLVRDTRDAAYELSFISLYGNPFMQWVGTTHAHNRTLKEPLELRYLPEVQAMLLGCDQGGLEAAVIRMLILMADSRGSVRRDRLERSAQVLTNEEPFASLSTDRRAAIIRQQSIIIEFEREGAIEGLPYLLPNVELRQRALDVVRYVIGPRDEMAPNSQALLARMEELLAQAPQSPPPRPRRTQPSSQEAMEVELMRPADNTQSLAVATPAPSVAVERRAPRKSSDQPIAAAPKATARAPAKVRTAAKLAATKPTVVPAPDSAKVSATDAAKAPATAPKRKAVRKPAAG